MADVKVKFGADFVDVQHAAHEISKLAKKTKKDVQEPFDSILESEKKVERSMGNMAKSIASLATPADAIAAVFDNMENSINGSLAVGVAAGIGVALNQVLNDAAKGMNAFTAKIEKSMSEAFDGTSAGVDKMRALMDDLAADKMDDGLFEKLIFGGQKDELIASQAKAIEMAERLVALRKEAESFTAVKVSSMETRASRLRNADVDDNTFVGAEQKAQNAEESAWIEFQIKKYKELKAAQEEYNKILQDKTSTDVAKSNASEIFEQIKERAKLESEALDRQISGARERRKLDRDLAEQARNDAIEQMTFLNEQEKLELTLQQSGEKLNTLTSSRASKEEEIKAAKLAQLKAAFDLEIWARKELAAYSEITLLQLQRTVIGKTQIEQQRLNVSTLDLIQKGLEDNAETEEDRKNAAEAMNKLLEERVKLAQMEREESERLIKIDHERIQMAERDPYVRAQNEAQFAKENAARVLARPDASESERQQALLDAERAKQGVIEAAVAAAPSLSEIAATSPENMKALSRAANRGGPNKFQQAQQAQATAAYARAIRASDPYDPATRARADSVQADADIQALRAQGLLGRDASDAANLRKMSDADRKAEMENRQNQAEQKAREAEQKSLDEERAKDNPIDDYKKKNHLDGKDEEKKEDEEDVSKKEMPGKKDSKPHDPMESIANDVAVIKDKIVLIEPKLPQQVLS